MKRLRFAILLAAGMAAAGPARAAAAADFAAGLAAAEQGDAAAAIELFTRAIDAGELEISAQANAIYPSFVPRSRSSTHPATAS